MVDGTGRLPDKMLKYRILSYIDAYRYCVGINYG